MSQQKTVAPATITLVCEISGLGEHVDNTVYGMLDLTSKKAKALLALRTVWENTKSDLGERSTTFYVIELWDQSIAFHPKINEKSFLPIEEDFNGEWNIAGRGIAGQQPNPKMYGYDTFTSSADRIRIHDTGVNWVGYIDNADNSPEFSTPQIPWASLEAIERGTPTRFNTIHASLDEEQPLPIGTECKYEQHGSDHTNEGYSGEKCTIVSVDSQHDDKPLDEPAMRSFMYTVKMKSTDEEIEASHYELSPIEE